MYKNTMLNKFNSFSYNFVFNKIVAINLTTFNLFNEAQYWLWSKNIDLGYFSKPPFLSWIIRAHTEIFGNSFALKLCHP